MAATPLWAWYPVYIPPQHSNDNPLASWNTSEYNYLMNGNPRHWRQALTSQERKDLKEIEVRIEELMKILAPLRSARLRLQNTASVRAGRSKKKK